MTAKQVAVLTGISVRTLHHYDNIGLLSPARSSENSYRHYSNKDLDMLQQILFFRECGFQLKQIKLMLHNPAFNKAASFDLQERCLLHEKKRIEHMLKTLRKTRKNMKGENTMTAKEKFVGLSMSSNPYEQEARELWGDAAVDSSKSHIESLSKAELEAIPEEMDALFTELAALLQENPASAPVQSAVARLYQFFNTNFGCRYTPEAFAGLGRLYVEDSRFTENIDQYGKGLSAFLCKAMGIYANTGS